MDRGFPNEMDNFFFISSEFGNLIQENCHSLKEVKTQYSVFDGSNL